MESTLEEKNSLLEEHILYHIERCGEGGGIQMAELLTLKVPVYGLV